jgi:hypothetical protein
MVSIACAGLFRHGVAIPQETVPGTDGHPSSFGALSTLAGQGHDKQSGEFCRRERIRLDHHYSTNLSHFSPLIGIEARHPDLAPESSPPGGNLCHRTARDFALTSASFSPSKGFVLRWKKNGRDGQGLLAAAGSSARALAAATRIASARSRCRRER